MQYGVVFSSSEKRLGARLMTATVISAVLFSGPAASAQDLGSLVRGVMAQPRGSSSNANSQGCGNGQALGAVGGAVIGGLLGSRVGGKNNRTTGAVVGAIAGLAIGGVIGKALDSCDRQKATAATETVLNTPDPGPGDNAATAKSGSRKTTPSTPAPPPPRTTWVSETNPGVSGSSEVTATHAVSDGSTCRTVRETAVVHGQELLQNVEYCRAPGQSAWVVKNA